MLYVKMYEINKKYKLNVKGDDGFRSFYIATILEEDDHCIRFETKDNEMLIVNKMNVTKAKRLEDGKRI